MINATTNGAVMGSAVGTSGSCRPAPAPLFAAAPNVAGAGVVQAPFQSPVQAPVMVQGSGPLTATNTAISVPANAGNAATAGVGALGATPINTGAAPAGASGVSRMTSVAPGGTQGDANLVEATLNVLRGSASGAAVVDRLLAVGARINVISDAEATAMGHGDAHAFFDPAKDTMYLRRSDLSGANLNFAAVAIAHEGTHLLDDAAGLAEPFIQQASNGVAALGGTATARGLEAQKQALFELTMIKETRAFVLAGQVARDLGVALPVGDPTTIAARGGNNQNTYSLVWQTLMTTAYNPDKRTAPARNF